MEKNASYTFKNERIFTTGAFLIPIEITKEGGEKVLMWVVDCFEDDSFKDGNHINPRACAENLADLLQEEEEIDDDDEDDTYDLDR